MTLAYERLWPCVTIWLKLDIWDIQCDNRWEWRGREVGIPVTCPCARETVKRSSGQVFQDWDVSLCSVLLCVIWFQNSDKNWCKWPYFRLGLTHFCSIQKPQFLFWVQCLSHGGPCYWQFGPWTTWTSSGSSDSSSETLSQTLHFLRFQHWGVWD